MTYTNIPAEYLPHEMRLIRNMEKQTNTEAQNLKH